MQYVSIIDMDFHIDRQQYWECNWTIDIDNQPTLKCHRTKLTVDIEENTNMNAKYFCVAYGQRLHGNSIATNDLMMNIYDYENEMLLDWRSRRSRGDLWL